MGKKKQQPAVAQSKKPETSAGPVPIKKVPSLRGKNQLPLYAAGSFTTSAPSPSRLPVPPNRWRSPPAGAAVASEPGPPAADQVAHPDETRLSILGNLLFLTLMSSYGDLTGKLVGMLLECGVDEVANIVASAEVRKEAVREALIVLRDAGDERAARHLKAPPPPAQAQPMLPPGLGFKLTVDVSAAQEAQAAAEGGANSTGLTPGLQGSMLMRVSPRYTSAYGSKAWCHHFYPLFLSPQRFHGAMHTSLATPCIRSASSRSVSSNKYSTNNILRGAGRF